MITNFNIREFPGGLVVRILGFHCCSLGSVPGERTEILQAMWHSQKQTNKRIYISKLEKLHCMCQKGVSSACLFHTLAVRFTCCSVSLPWTSLVAQLVKNPAIQETWVQSLGWEDPLEEGLEPTPVFLPGESRGQRSLVGYSLRGLRVRHA